jgi:peptide/nickel transport system substrate-binding protein
MPLGQGQVLNNRYRIVRLIGQGGFGAVYRAWDTSLKLPVAVKENLDTSQEAQRQFEREASLMAGLRHPNLPRVTDHFLIPGQGQYLVMDFIEGHDLETMLVQQGRPFTEAEVRPWIEQVCSALSYLHSRTPPIIHRDIKPQNIIITTAGQAMLVDFGISKIYDANLRTTVGAKAVTPGYSPPEQYGSGVTDARADIYALGSTLYYLLTGQDPPESVQRLVGQATLPPLHQFNVQVTPALEQAIVRATEVTTDRRFQTVDELVAMLRQPASSVQQPYLAPAVPPSQAQPLPQLASAIPSWAWILGAVLFVSFFVVAVASYYVGSRGSGEVASIVTATFNATPLPAVVSSGTTAVSPSSIAPETATTLLPAIATSTVTVQPTSTATPSPSPSPTPKPKNLVICMAAEPDTLYLYGGSMLATSAVQHGIYENLITNLSFAYQAQGIEKVPALANGDALLRNVSVRAGETIVNSSGDLVTLQRGERVMNASGQEVTFDSGSITMSQLVVNFTLKPMVWSDGTPVTAADSVFSFELASHADTPAGKFKVTRTAGYKALDNLRLEWTGVPGFQDSTYFTNVWTPLPRHQLARFTAARLLEIEETARRPLASGPFVVTKWVAGDRMELVKNPHYYRSAEGLPYLDTVTFKFIPNTNQLVTQLLSGQCDIGTQDGIDISQSSFLIEAEGNGLLKPYFQTGTVYEHIDFNISPVDDRPRWFTDVRVRQAMTMCTNRQGMVDNIFYGRSEVIHSYIPRIHPLYPTNVTEWPYDVNAAKLLLEQAGYRDRNGDGIRQDPVNGRPFRITLGTTSGNEMRQRLTQIFKEDMKACGIEVELYYMPASQLFADGPDGPLFGRRYDLGEFAWLTGVEPACSLYSGNEIPGPANSWIGQNNTGWNDSAFTAACTRAIASLPGTAEYTQYHQQALRIFAENVPIIPLFLRVKVAVTRPEVRNFRLDATQNSELWNLFEIDLDNG